MSKTTSHETEQPSKSDDIIRTHGTKHQHPLLKSLLLKNFQKHKATTINFRTDRRVTIIAGRNGAGKTAIVRALRWLFLCDGSDGLRRHGSKYVKVVARFEGHIAIRKIAKERYYKVDGEKIVATGRNVPEAVSRLSGLSALNFQVQHEGLFWVSSSAGMIGKEVGRLSGIQPIMKAMEIARTELRDVKSKINAHTEVSDECQSYLEQTKWADEALSALKDQDEIEAELEALQSRVFAVRGKLGKIRRLTISGVSEDELQKMSEAARTSGRDLQVLIDRIRKVREACQRVASLQRDLEKQSRALEALQESFRSIKSCPVCRKPFSHSPS